MNIERLHEIVTDASVILRVGNTENMRDITVVEMTEKTSGLVISKQLQKCAPDANVVGVYMDRAAPYYDELLDILGRLGVKLNFPSVFSAQDMIAVIGSAELVMGLLALGQVLDLWTINVADTMTCDPMPPVTSAMRRAAGFAVVIISGFHPKFAAILTSMT